MRAVKGDVIGTKDGRYGTVVVVSKLEDRLDVIEFDTKGVEAPVYFAITQADVASIV